MLDQLQVEEARAETHWWTNVYCRRTARCATGVHARVSAAAAAASFSDKESSRIWPGNVHTSVIEGAGTMNAFVTPSGDVSFGSVCSTHCLCRAVWDPRCESSLPHMAAAIAAAAATTAAAGV